MLRKSIPFFIAFLLGWQTAEAASELARLRLSAGLVEWLPQVNAEELVLRLAGPDGIVRSWWFAAGAVPALALSDESGQPLPDGLYTYELRATPRLPQGLRQQLRSARAAGDEAAVQRLQAEIPQPLVQTGTFRILGGAVPAGERAEAEPGSMAKDQMVPDDLIVDGKGCIGLGCANGESFFSEALRLKQSVVRLRFVDTSTSAGFPTRDWQVAINDASSGGGDRFSIEDLTAGRTPFTIQGDAPDNALFVDASGRIGLRTATPAQDLHVASGNTPALRLEQTTAGGFPARAWDVTANDTAFAVKDFTGSTTPLQIKPGAPTNSLYLNAAGNLGLGTASPQNKLHVNVTIPGQGIVIDGGTGNAVNMWMQGDSAGFIFNDLNGSVNRKVTQTYVNADLWRLRGLNDAINTETVAGISFDLADGDVGINCNSAADHDLVVKGGGSCTATPRSWVDAGQTSFSISSSRSIKENVRPLQVAGILDKIAQIPVYEYDFIAGPKGHIGLMAEDFHAIFGRGSPAELSGHELQLALWLSVQELAAQKSEIQKENHALQQRLSALENEIQLDDAKVEEQRQTIEKQQEVIRLLEERLARLEREQ